MVMRLLFLLLMLQLIEGEEWVTIWRDEMTDPSGQRWNYFRSDPSPTGNNEYTFASSDPDCPSGSSCLRLLGQSVAFAESCIVQTHQRIADFDAVRLKFDYHRKDWTNGDYCRIYRIEDGVYDGRWQWEGQDLLINFTVPMCNPCTAEYITISLEAGPSGGTSSGNTLKCLWDNVELQAIAPTTSPTAAPTNIPSLTPSEYPSKYPTTAPTRAPSDNPINAPTDAPTNIPSSNPTKVPKKVSIFVPTQRPVEPPTTYPSVIPTENPVTIVPTTAAPSQDNGGMDISVNGLSIDLMYILLGTLIVICNCLFCAVVVFVFYKKGDNKKRKDSAMMMQMNSVSHTEMIRAVSENTDVDAFSSDADKLFVLKWLSDIGMKEYYAQFVKNGYSSKKYIKTIESTEELKEIGIPNMAHRKLIMNAIKKLSNDEKDKDDQDSVERLFDEASEPMQITKKDEFSDEGQEAIDTEIGTEIDTDIGDV